LLLEFGGTSSPFSLEFEELVEYLIQVIGGEQAEVQREQEQTLKWE